MVKPLQTTPNPVQVSTRLQGIARAPADVPNAADRGPHRLLVRMERVLEKQCVKKCLCAVLLQHVIDDLDQLVLIVTEMLVSEGLSFTDTLVRELILEINLERPVHPE